MDHLDKKDVTQMSSTLCQELKKNQQPTRNASENWILGRSSGSYPTKQ